MQRFKFSTWESKVILQTQKLSFGIEDYKTGLFDVINADDYYSFNYTEAMHISNIFWNSICITYDYKDFLLKLFINGKAIQAKHEAENSSKEKYNFSDSPLILGDFEQGREYSLTGQVTDLNFWSQPLTMEQVIALYEDCGSNLIEEIQPDYIQWSNVNITFQSNNSLTGFVNPKNFCGTINQTIIIPYNMPYKEALQNCKKLSGDMPMPKDTTTLTALFELFPNYPAYSSCRENKFWLPAIKVGGAWIHDTPVLPQNQIEITADLVRTSQKPENCMLLDVEGKIFQEIPCSEEICSLCQINEEKLKFEINAFCEMDAKIDSSYFLTNAPNLQLEFQGISGLSIIANLPKDDVWNLFLSNNKSQILMSTNASQLPIGKNSWDVVKAGQDCFNSPNVDSSKIILSFSNVSKLYFSLQMDSAINVAGRCLNGTTSVPKSVPH